VKIYLAKEKSTLKRSVITFSFFAMGLIMLTAHAGGVSAGNKKSAPTLATCLLRVRIQINPVLDSAFSPTFSKALFGALEQKFTNIHLCLDTCRSGCFEGGHGGVDLSIGYEPEEDTSSYSGSIVVKFEKTGAGELEDVDLNQILTLFKVPTGIDRGGLYMVVAEKIVENVRREMLGEVKVSIIPEGAVFMLDSTLGRNRSPKTLLLPPGAYILDAWLPKYLPYRGEIKVAASGVTEVKVSLTKRRFYHSRCMPVSSALCGATMAAFVAEYYFYDQYAKLDKTDYTTRPDEFAKRFNRARNAEYTGFTLLGLTAASFALTFFF
jgi:hypothetical protein